MRREHEAHNPSLTRGWATILEEAGLRIDWREVTPGRALDPNEGGLPHEAARYGVTLHVQYEYLIAVKP
jgi:hypothetical protein